MKWDILKKKDRNRWLSLITLLLNMKKYILSICVIYFLITLCVCPNTTATVPVIDHAKILNSKGYPTDTTEQIIEATKSKSYFIRYVALILLTERTGKQAIPKLKEALNDSEIKVRWHAAHLLGTLNDNSGLERMRKDYEEFAPKDSNDVPTDPNTADPNEKRRQEAGKNINTRYALNVAKVLAELGDLRGYELAARMAFAGPRTYIRMEAVRAMAEIAKIDKKVLSAEKKYPETILTALVELEKDPRFFMFLVSSVENIGGGIAVRVLERAIASPHQSEETRRIAEARLNRVRAKIKADEKKTKIKEVVEARGRPGGKTEKSAKGKQTGQIILFEESTVFFRAV